MISGTKVSEAIYRESGQWCKYERTEFIAGVIHGLRLAQQIVQKFQRDNLGNTKRWKYKDGVK